MSNIKFGDSVQIIGGFYEGCEGIVLEERSNGHDYLIELHKICKNNISRSEETVIQEGFLKIN